MTTNYIPLLNHPDYEIMNEYPFTIRRARDRYEISESFNNQSYPWVSLNGRMYLKHRLIAEQFIPNDDPDHKNQVDHINRDRSDYHLDNLRWVTPSMNNRNKSSSKGVTYEYVDDLPLDVVPIILYKRWEFEGYVIDSNGEVWFDNGEQFRKLYIDMTNCVTMEDIYHRRHHIGIRGLRREFM